MELPATTLSEQRTARARTYVREVGVPPAKVESAVASVATVLAAAESAQLDLFPFPGPRAETQKLSKAAAERLRVEQAAEALRSPSDPAKLRAAFSASPRISSIIPALVRDPKKAWDIRGAKIAGPRDFAALLAALRSPYVETFKVVLLNASSQVIHSEITSIGSTTAAIADPAVLARTIQRLPRSKGAQRVLIAHNHPSGVPDPSAPDVEITRRFNSVCNELGYELFDHVITNGHTYYSFREAGMINTGALTARAASRARPAFVGEDAVPVALGTKAPWEILRRDELVRVAQQEVAGEMFGALRQVDPSAAYIAYLTRKNTLLGLERVSGYDARPDVLSLKRTIFDGVGREGACAFIVGLPDALSRAQALQDMRALRQFGKESYIELLDLFQTTIADHGSARSAGLLEERTEYRVKGAKRQVARAPLSTDRQRSVAGIER